MEVSMDLLKIILIQMKYFDKIFFIFYHIFYRTRKTKAC